MKKIISLVLAAVMSVGLLTGCGEKNDSSSSNLITNRLSEKQLAEWDNVKEYKIDDITYKIPNAWKKIDTTEEILSEDEYQKYGGNDLTFSVQLNKVNICENPTPDDLAEYIDFHFDNSAQLKECTSYKINDIACYYFKMRSDDNDDYTVKLVCQSTNGIVFFNFYDNTDTNLLVSEMMLFVKMIKGNIAFKNQPNEYVPEQTVKVGDWSFDLPQFSNQDPDNPDRYLTEWGFIEICSIELPYRISRFEFADDYYIYYKNEEFKSGKQGKSSEIVENDIIAYIDSNILFNEFIFAQKEWVSDIRKPYEPKVLKLIYNRSSSSSKIGQFYIICISSDKAILIYNNWSADNALYNYDQFIESLDYNGELTIL